MTKDADNSHAAAERNLTLVNENDPGQAPVRVAFATGDNEHVDQHFGSARAFLIYGLHVEQISLIGAVQFKPVEPGHDNGKLQAKLDALKACHAVFSVECGPSAVAQLVKMGVQPLKAPNGSAIKDLARDLQKQLQEEPSGWLAQAIGVSPPPVKGNTARLQDMLDEDW